MRKRLNLTFTEFVDRTGVDLELIASKCAVTGAAVRRMHAGTLKPGLDLALKIEELTLGVVRCESWPRNSKGAGRKR